MAAEIAPRAEKMTSGDLKIDSGFGEVAKSWVAKICSLIHGNTPRLRDHLALPCLRTLGPTRGNMKQEDRFTLN